MSFALESQLRSSLVNGIWWKDSVEGCEVNLRLASTWLRHLSLNPSHHAVRRPLSHGKAICGCGSTEHSIHV